MFMVLIEMTMALDVSDQIGEAEGRLADSAESDRD